MSDDYFTKLDEQLSALTSEGAHLDRWARWRPLDRAARRTVAALGLVVLLAALLVIEFPGSASGSMHRGTSKTAQAAPAAPGGLRTAVSTASDPRGAGGDLSASSASVAELVAVTALGGGVGDLSATRGGPTVPPASAAGRLA